MERRSDGVGTENGFRFVLRSAPKKKNQPAMKFLPLIWAGVWRKPVRTIFTALSIAIAFLLIGLLQGVNAGFAKTIAEARLDLLTTDARVRGSPPMPISMVEEIRKVPGVVQVVQRAYFTGVYRPPNDVAGLATEPTAFFELRPGLRTEAKYLDAMSRTRSGMLVTPALMTLFDWHIGDTVTLRSRERKLDGSGDWEFTIVGTFDAVENPNTARVAIINYSYLDEARAMNRGTIERIYIRIDDPTRAIATATAIDRLFENSAHETRTRSDQERAEAETSEMGDIAFFTNAIVAAVLFTLLFVTANMMRQSLRERTAEFGVLKAMGFSDRTCAVLALGEALFVCVTAGALGLGLAALVAPLGRDIVAELTISETVLMRAAICAIALAIVSVALPSWRLYRLPIVQSLSVR